MCLRVEAGPVATLEIQRPERANAYDQLLLEALQRAIDELGGVAKAVVVQSQGDGAFCAGADLDELGRAQPEDALELRSQRVFTRLARAPFVSIAAVHGPASGGGLELALACDLRVAGPSARFALPETQLGLIPAAGGTTRLPRLVGASRARALVLGGEVVDATTASTWGLVNRVADDCRAEARSWAQEIARRDPLALRLAKLALLDDREDASLRLERLVEAVLYGRRSS